MDITTLPNPYDFANPVSNAKLFVGRKQELEEIRYYLDHAKRAPRPINLALLGHRASGKTSLLNMTEIEAKEKGLCVARIDLNEDDSRNQMGFFFKIIDGVLAAACEMGAFGGTQSKTYDTYLDVVNAFEIPEDKTFCPLLFPLQYAKAAAAKNFEAPITEHNYRSDLLKIRSEVKAPIAILFDECNVLANSRVHLEKLRNIFMNTPGFMLVITGTPDMFPVMDEVFSPIVRQFKKIEVKQFANSEDTADCILKPLESLGLVPADNYFVMSDVEEIHNLAGGKPYEIQLICHLLFRRLQSKRAGKMRLGFSVLEDLRRELESTQDVSARPILAKLKSFDEEELVALATLTKCNGRATFEQLWILNEVVTGIQLWTKPELQSFLERYCQLGVLTLREDLITFTGDYFDQLYVKYLAKEQGVALDITEATPDVYFLASVMLMSKEIQDLDYFGWQSRGEPSIDIETLVATLADNKKLDVFEEGPSYLKDIYFLMFRYRQHEEAPIIRFRLEFSWVKIHVLFESDDPETTGPLDSAWERLEQISNRAIALGAKVQLDRIKLPVIPVKDLAEQVLRTANERLRDTIANQHMMQVWSEYVKNSNIAGAIENAEMVFRYGIPLDSEEANNLGYLFLSVDQLGKAAELLKTAIATNGHRTPLAHYNLGVLYAKDHKIHDAIREIESCLDLVEKKPPEDNFCSCLIVPRSINGILQFDEVKYSDAKTSETGYGEVRHDDSDDEEHDEPSTETVSLLAIAQQALKVLKQHAGT